MRSAQLITQLKCNLDVLCILWKQTWKPKSLLAAVQWDSVTTLNNLLKTSLLFYVFSSHTCRNVSVQQHHITCAIFYNLSIEVFKRNKKRDESVYDNTFLLLASTQWAEHNDVDAQTFLESRPLKGAAVIAVSAPFVSSAPQFVLLQRVNHKRQETCSSEQRPASEAWIATPRSRDQDLNLWRNQVKII